MQGLSLLFIRAAKIWHNLRHWPEVAAGRRRRRWDGAARWYRLRYRNEAQIQAMIDRLSRAGGRVALRLRADGAVRCWLGVPPRYEPVLLKMAGSFGCALEESTPPVAWDGLFSPAASLPEEPADAYVVGGRLYATGSRSQAVQGRSRTEGWSHTVQGRSPAGGRRAGFVFPPDRLREDPLPWQMPRPVLGLSTQASLSLAAGGATWRQGGQWLLGWDNHSHSVGDRQAGVVGDPEAVMRWLSAFVLAAWQEGNEPLAVIDGRGQWLDSFLKLPAVHHRVLSRQVRVMDIHAGRLPFNPLALPRSGSRKGAAVRWLWWFKGMGLPEHGLKQMIPPAIQNGVSHLPALYQWVGAHKVATPGPALPLQQTIERLDRETAVREWILAHDRFRDPRLLVAQTPLLITPRLRDGDGWSRLQAVRGLLGLLMETDAAIVLHDLKLAAADKKLLQQRKLIVTNAPGATTVITRCTAPIARKVTSLVPLPLPVSEEHLQLLPAGTAVVAHRAGQAATVSWRHPAPYPREASSHV